MRRANSTRHLEVSSFAAFLPLLALVPVWLVALTSFWFPVWLVVRNPPLWLVAVVHVGMGLALLFRPVAQRFLTQLLGTRPPTAGERRHVEPLWQGVLLHTRLGSKRFILAVVDSDDLNAFASAGRLVVVTTGALETLPPAELQGVLAHEIGHHLGLDGAAITLGYWLALPVLALARVGYFLQNVATAATQTFASASPVWTLVGRGVAGILRGIAKVLEGSIRVWQALGGIATRRAEYRADDWAVRLGFGLELAAAMRRTVNDEPPASHRSRADRLFGTHPPLRTRIARVEARARQAPFGPPR